MEVLLSFGLLSALIFTLLSSFTNFSKLSAKIAKERSPIFQQKYFHEQMTRVFATTSPASIKLETLGSSDSPSLTFIFDGGVDPDPAFAGINQGKIIVSPTRDLMLTTTSLTEIEKAPRTITFMDHVTELTCSLDTPGTVLLHVKDEADEITSYAFFLPPKDEEGLLMKREGEL